MRSWKERNRARIAEYQRAWKAEHRDTPLQVAKERARHQRYREQNRERDNARALRKRHGMTSDEDIPALLQAQNGLCYLCGLELAPENRHVDHDHSHCPRNRSCRICRRGLAHRECNLAIGYVDDDPVRLRRMADALEAAQLAFRQRLAAADVTEQVYLFSALDLGLPG